MNPETLAKIRSAAYRLRTAGRDNTEAILNYRDTAATSLAFEDAEEALIGLVADPDIILELLDMIGGS